MTDGKGEEYIKEVIYKRTDKAGIEGADRWLKKAIDDGIGMKDR